MKAALVLLFGLLTALGARGAWQEELTFGVGPFPLCRPFHAHYNFGWKMFTAAEADVDFQLTKLGAAQTSLTAASTGVVRSMWRMDARHYATMDPLTLRPIAASQVEIYKDETVTTKLLFSPEGVERTRSSNAPGEPPVKTKRFKVPVAFDLNSAIWFLRSQRLQPGDNHKIVVYPAAGGYLAQVNVLERTKVKAAGQQWPAIRLDLHLWRINKDLQLEAHEKFKRCSIWLSDDANRLPLRIEGEIHVGAVWAELEHVDWK